MQTAKRGVVFLAILAAASLAVAQTGKGPAKAPPAAQPAHAPTKPADLKWTPIIPGAEIAVVSGNPDATGQLFTIRFKMADGTKVPPHWHPTDEHVTVLQGTFLVGMGEKFDAAGLNAMATGAYMVVPKEMRHFAQSRGATLVQVHGMGPFKIIWVNPADDPANKAAAAKKK